MSGISGVLLVILLNPKNPKLLTCMIIIIIIGHGFDNSGVFRVLNLKSDPSA